MDSNPPIGKSRERRAKVVLLTACLILLCLVPFSYRLRHPSLFSDDVVRIIFIQVLPLKARLFRPFNEHIAPVFESITLATWSLAGRKLTNAPLAFTVAAYVPFVLVLGLLILLVRRELGSRTAAWTAGLIFGLSSIYAETVYWFSASSFQWALLGTLCVFFYTSGGTGSPLRYCGAALCAAIAPACSAIGLVAGPLGTCRLLMAPGQRRSRRSLIAAAVPSAGTALYLIVYLLLQSREVLSSNVERKLTLSAGLIALCRAPTEVLLPGLIGLRLDRAALPLALNLGVFGVGLLGILWWARHSLARPLILGGLGLVLGGYSICYLVRSPSGSYWPLQVERYHLFPQAGFTLLVVAALGRWLRRLDRRPILGTCLVLGLAALLLVRHTHQLRVQTQRYRFPEQRQFLAALERLDTICRANRVTRGQALAALDPIQTRWSPDEHNPIGLLPGSVSEAVHPTASVRPMLLAALSSREREALCGGMDASGYLRLARELAGPEPIDADVGRLVKTFRVRPTGFEGQYISVAGMAYLEYQLDCDAGPGRFLCIPGGASSKPWEIWWSDAMGSWQETRSIRWKVDGESSPQDWAVPLDHLPNWSPADSLRIRIVVRSKGPIAVGAPRLLR